MKLAKLLEYKSDWLSNKGPLSDIVLSSRVRLARNLDRLPFPERASAAQQAQAYDLIKTSGKKNSYLKNAAVYNLEELDKIDRQFLMERHLVSFEHANGPGARGVIIGDHDLVSMMINEEDHIRLQGLQSGLQLRELWNILQKIDRETSKHLCIAFSGELGYLTACPTNTGTGLRASLLVHLPAMMIRNEIDPLLRMLGKLGIVARGFYGEGTKVMGNMFQISNQLTLGPMEEAIIDKLESIGRKIVENETNSRKLLYEENRNEFENRVFRAYGLLSSARAISFNETLELISMVKLGIGLGLEFGICIETLNELMVLSQPAHLQEAAGRALPAKLRDIERADLIRKRLQKEGKDREHYA